jgi:hypothetical protein
LGGVWLKFCRSGVMLRVEAAMPGPDAHPKLLAGWSLLYEGRPGDSWGSSEGSGNGSHPSRAHIGPIGRWYRTLSAVGILDCGRAPL